MAKKEEELLDLVIIGAAAAGCSAAIYAARRNLNFVVITKDIGGEVALSGEVENWPGQIHTTGIQLAQDFHKHALDYKVKIDEGLIVADIKQEKQHHIVVVKDGNGNEKTYKTKTVLIGTGIHPRELGIPGEAKLKGKGITSCTVCDGPLFKGKVTATIGAGNSALESVLMMAGIAKKVYVITKHPNDPKMQGGFPKGEGILINKMKVLSNVEIINNANTTEILGDAFVTGLRYEDAVTKEKKELHVDGVMVHIGMIPNSEFVKCAKKNAQGEVEVDILCRTSCAGVFAAGDITNVPYKQIAIAAGQGVTAALSVIDYLNKWEE